MRLWNPKRPRKSRPGSRFNTLFPSQTAYDGGDDHAFSSSSNGYGPQVISDKGFRPNNLAILPSGDGVATRSSSNYRTDSPVSDSSSTRQKRFEPWSPSTVNEQIDTCRSSREENCELDDEPGPSHDGLWSWIPYVPQSADDDTVLYHVKEVFLFAEQFVVNFYTDRKATSEISQEVLSKVNRSQLLSDGELQTQLSDATYHTTLIRHILISLMLDLISFESVASASLLPKEFQNYIAIAQARTRSNADEITNLQPALSAYRVLSAYLHPNSASDQVYQDERRQVSEKVGGDFRSAFDQWLDEGKTQEDWEASFHSLIDKTATLGIFLFSQPSVFFFNWEMTAEDESARLVPVTPRLLRVFDDAAQFREISDHMISMKCGRAFEDSAVEVQEQSGVRLEGTR